MKQCIIFLSTLIFLAFAVAAQVNADMVVLHNGDRLIGTIQTRSFALQTPYGQIVIKKDFLKRISLPDRQLREAKLQTINNDLFNGTLVNEDLQIKLQSGTNATLNVGEVKLVMCDTSGPSYSILTTIFITQNNDRFSGKVINARIDLEADFGTTTYQPKDINRIEFTGEDKHKVRILLTSGDVVAGRLKFDDFLIAPDSLDRLTVDMSILSSLQFNARKLVLKEYAGLAASAKDGDDDGIPDAIDKCPQTPWGAGVDETGCSRRPVVAGLPKKRSDALDTDNDGVLDPLDQCPQTPRTAMVDDRGCWAIPDVLFDFDSTEIKPQYQPALDVIIAVLKTNPNLNIEIHGNTDNIGPESYNQMLSEKRALAVKDYISNKGVAPQRMKAVGFGATRNVASNENDTGRALNRRIDFVPIN